MEGSDSEVLNFGVAVSYEWVCHMIGSRPPLEGGPGRDYMSPKYLYCLPTITLRAACPTRPIFS